VFQDPITKAEGRRQYEAQWYGLKAVFSEIERLHYCVTSSGNPIKMDLKTRYVIKIIGKEHSITSIVDIHTNSAGKISMVEDRWDGKLPESAIAQASLAQLFSANWWFNYCIAWLFWLWSFAWWSRPWLVRRFLKYPFPTDFCPNVNHSCMLTVNSNRFSGNLMQSWPLR
jgi:hypothetical protein